METFELRIFYLMLEALLNLPETKESVDETAVLKVSIAMEPMVTLQNNETQTHCKYSTIERGATGYVSVWMKYKLTDLSSVQRQIYAHSSPATRLHSTRTKQHAEWLKNDDSTRGPNSTLLKLELKLESLASKLCRPPSERRLAARDQRPWRVLVRVELEPLL